MLSIKVDRSKAIKKKEEPSHEEVTLLGKFSIKMSMVRAEEDERMIT